MNINRDQLIPNFKGFFAIRFLIIREQHNFLNLKYLEVHIFFSTRQQVFRRRKLETEIARGLKSKARDANKLSR